MSSNADDLESRLCSLVVAGVVAILEEDKVVLDHDVPAQDHGQELVVAHLLIDCRHDVSGLLQLWCCDVLSMFVLSK